MYKEDMIRKGEKRLISERHFVGQMWKKEFPNVIIPKVYKTFITITSNVQKRSLILQCVFSAIKVHKMYHLCPLKRAIEKPKINCPTTQADDKHAQSTSFASNVSCCT